MNDHELDRLLRLVRTPEPQPEGFEDALRQVRPHRSVSLEPAQRPRPWVVAWALSAAAACLLIGFAIGHWRGQHVTVPASAMLQNPKLISEVCAMFPNRVRALVQDETGLRLELSDEADLPESTPLWLRISQGGRMQSFVTFSGQQVEVAGQRLTVLAATAGNVLVVADRFVWSTEEPGHRPEDFQIEAKVLNFVAAK